MMKCDICREKPAVIFVQQVSRGSTIELHLCEVCAKERGFATDKNRVDISLGSLFSELVSSDEGANTSAQACPSCGSTLDSIRKRLRVGCGECYRRFSLEILSLLRADGIEVFPPGLTEAEVKDTEGMPVLTPRLFPKDERQGSDFPTAPGFTPTQSEYPGPDHTASLETLKRELSRAIEQENYELAAYYRDRIREKEGRL